MNMKNILKFLAGAAIAVTAVSCDLNKYPVFDDADAFVAFDKAIYTFNEGKGVVEIPVTLASVKPMKTVVTYELAAEGNTAVEGDDFTFSDETGTLTFDGTSRTQKIVIDIKGKYIGDYTKDKKFTINLVNASKINLGADASCTITISDLDHPLADLLGTYSAVGKSWWGDDYAWEMTFMKDSEDVDIVWIDNFAPGFGPWNVMDFRVYGIVSEDRNTISIPSGQGVAYRKDCIWCISSEPFYYDKEGELVIEKTAGTSSFVFKNGYCALKVDDAGEVIGVFDALTSGVVITKK